jgi:transcriptional regulator GlxA family with amidase domain
MSPTAASVAIHFIMANLDRPLSVADIAQASHVSVRTLRRSFALRYGSTPTRLLRSARLDRVRTELLASNQHATVTSAALAWGFAHLGRFSQEYRRRFGERPSDTLKRRLRETSSLSAGRYAMADS